MRRAAFIAAAAAVAAACAWGVLQLWDTSVPGGLDLDTRAAAATFDAAAREDAERFEAVMRWLFVASQAALVAALVVYARRGVRLFQRESAAGPIGTGFLLGMMGLALVWLVQLPFGLVEIWWTRRNDALEVGYVEYVVGDFFGLAGEALFLCLLLLVVMALARLLRSAWWLPGVAVLAGLAALAAWLTPYLIVELEKPPAGIAADARPLAAKQGVEGVPVRIEDVHEYTEQPNAYAAGLGESRRVVLWNTLSEDFPRREVRSVLSHEFGHLQHDHIAKGIGWFAIFALPAALIVTLVTRRRGGLGEPAAVPLALLVLVVLQLAASPLTSAGSRRYEAEADWAALEATRDPRAMVALHHRFTEEALSDPDPPGWFHTLFDSHPSGAERVAMARAWRERSRSR
ncbi:MAG TPA: M48 family metalloprotease [Solirubrobacteraceae bacterium]|nr:M48 family metalloprotease [Solirubrobacteraceae bacterium]